VQFATNFVGSVHFYARNIVEKQIGLEGQHVLSCGKSRLASLAVQSFTCYLKAAAALVGQAPALQQ
jgi:hypothetical protein